MERKIGRDSLSFQNTCIFRLYYTPLCLYATSITGEQEVAEEIVQDLFYVYGASERSGGGVRAIYLMPG